jgi:hypothetical protein
VAVPESVEVPEPLVALRIPADVEGLARELYAVFRLADEAKVDVAVISVRARKGSGSRSWTGCGGRRPAKRLMPSMRSHRPSDQ